jgi:hypothetical protein
VKRDLEGTKNRDCNSEGLSWNNWGGGGGGNTTKHPSKGDKKAVFTRQGWACKGAGPTRIGGTFCSSTGTF